MDLDEKAKTLLGKELVDVLCEQEITISALEQSDNTARVELEFFSPLGEDVCLNIEYSGSITFAKAVEVYANDFSPDEHAEMWYKNRHVISGVPESQQELIDDAKSIKELLCETASKLSKAERTTAKKARLINDGVERA